MVSAVILIEYSSMVLTRFLMVRSETHLDLIRFYFTITHLPAFSLGTTIYEIFWSYQSNHVQREPITVGPYYLTLRSIFSVGGTGVPGENQRLSAER